MYQFFMQTFMLDHRVRIKIIDMNKTIDEVTVYNPINIENYQIFFKGIWTGVLISLIFHHLIFH